MCASNLVLPAGPCRCCVEHCSVGDQCRPGETQRELVLNGTQLQMSTCKYVPTAARRPYLAHTALAFVSGVRSSTCITTETRTRSQRFCGRYRAGASQNINAIDPAACETHARTQILKFTRARTQRQLTLSTAFAARRTHAHVHACARQAHHRSNYQQWCLPPARHHRVRGGRGQGASRRRARGHYGTPRAQS